MPFKSEERFELRGKFGGFFRNEEGKRRMRVHQGSKEVHVKTPKALRQHLLSVLTPDCEIVVSGIRKRKGWFGAVKYVALTVEAIPSPTASSRTDATATRAAVPSACIRFCAKKNCWKRGGEQLWKELEQRVEALGLSDSVKLKAVGCMDNCKRPPSVLCRGSLVPPDADAILKEIGAPTPPA